LQVSVFCIHPYGEMQFKKSGRLQNALTF